MDKPRTTLDDVGALTEHDPDCDRGVCWCHDPEHDADPDGADDPRACLECGCTDTGAPDPDCDTPSGCCHRGVVEPPDYGNGDGDGECWAEGCFCREDG